jgi:hypothetical protein
MVEMTFVLRFPDAGINDANRYARSLRDTLRELDESGARLEVQRNDPESQDFGATLVLVLGTSAVAALAEGIKTWLSRNSGARIEILQNGRIVAEHLDSKDAAAIATALSQHS